LTFYRAVILLEELTEESCGKNTENPDSIVTSFLPGQKLGVYSIFIIYKPRIKFINLCKKIFRTSALIIPI
jgi:hypothetical protein